jgi:NAD(P)-dependent dehydrogenase (short-subunit alcohol dehydrogenase family)
VSAGRSRPYLETILIWAALTLALLQTEDGIEQTLAINYYSHALLTLGLLPVIRSTPQSRIVFMASFGEVLGILDWDNLK